MFQLLTLPAIDRIFYLFKPSEAFESAYITNLALGILFFIVKRPYMYLQFIELENCRMYNFLKLYIQFLLSFVYPYILKSQSFWRCYTNTSSPIHASLALFDRFCIHRLCITGKQSGVQWWFFLICILLTRSFIETKRLSATNHPYFKLLHA